MNLDNHERAKRLLVADQIENIQAEELQWLHVHLAGCSECSNEANALILSIASLRALRVSVPVDTVRRTSLAVQRRAEELREQREKAVPLWIAAVTSSSWAVLTTPYLWSAFAWLGRQFQVPDMMWRAGFLMWWFLPATVLGAVAGWHHVARRRDASNWVTEADWR
jgi:hypothetical protein